MEGRTAVHIQFSRYRVNWVVGRDYRICQRVQNLLTVYQVYY